mgnify:CR=1 FL=1
MVVSFKKLKENQKNRETVVGSCAIVEKQDCNFVWNVIMNKNKDGLAEVSEKGIEHAPKGIHALPILRETVVGKNKETFLENKWVTGGEGIAFHH